MYQSSPAMAAGPVISFVGALGLFGSIVPRWFSVLVKYPTDQVLNHYGVLALGRGSLHSYVAFGWLFEALTLLAAAVGLVAAVYSAVAMHRAQSAAVVSITSGAVALGVVLVSSITFEIANPRSDGVLGSDLRLGPGALIAATSAVVIVVGGLLARRYPVRDRH